jgi:glycosyltransferase involved in cell wall biosynthesis
MRHVLVGLASSDRYVIDLIGINFFGDYYDRGEFPLRIYPAYRPGSRELHGRERLVRALSGKDQKLLGPWRVLFTLHDDYVLEPVVPKILEAKERLGREGRPLSWIAYWPVDNTIKEHWVREAMVKADVNVFYTEFGLREILRFDPDDELGYRERTRVVPHGVDISIYRPLPRDDVARYREHHFRGRVGPETFLVTNVNRNQWRKDISRTMAVFAEFHRRVPDSFLYLHMAANDRWSDLTEVARNFDLVLGRDWGCPQDFDVSTGVSPEELNYLYNASNAVVTTTLGEGWGLSITEAMAAGALVVAPHNSSIPELLGNRCPDDAARGLSVKCGGPSLWVHGGRMDHDSIRPLTDVEDMVDKLIFAQQNPGRVEEIVREAHAWVQHLSWERVMSEHWLPLFEDAARQV